MRAYELSRRLAARGHEVTIISGRYPASRDYAEDGLSFKFLGSSRNYAFSTFSFAWEAARFMREHGNGVDIMVEDFAPWNPVFSAFQANRPAVLHVNHKEGWNIIRRWLLCGLPFFIVEMFYPRLFSAVTALSEATREKIGIPDASIIPAGINSHLIDCGTQAAASDAAGYLMYIGRLHIKNKRLDTLVQAMKGLDAKLVIVGKGKDEMKLINMTKKLKLTNIEFSGHVSEEEKIEKLKCADMLVLPSRFEGWGIVVLEAAACGKPVIVSDIPELKYAVDAGFGLSFRTGNANDLAKKICFLLENEPLRKEMGRRAREYARNFTWDKIAVDYEQYLLGVIRGS